MKTIPVGRREQIEKEIHDCTPGFRFTSSDRVRFELMTWQQIQSLDPNLITIGSHTATHIDLPQADPERWTGNFRAAKKFWNLGWTEKSDILPIPTATSASKSCRS